MKSQILFKIDKRLREKKIVEKRVLIIGSMFSILVWMATLDIIINFIGRKLTFMVFCLIMILVYLSTMCYKVMKEEFLNLEYEINQSKNQTQTKSKYWRLNINKKRKVKEANR